LSACGKSDFRAQLNNLNAGSTRMIFPLPEHSVVDADNVDAVQADLTVPR